MRLNLSIAVFFLLLSACAGATGPVVSSGDRYVQATSAGEDYRLGPGDKIRITVFNEPTLSGEFSVTADGLFSAIEFECLGSCTTAPAIQVNGEFHENLDVPQVEALIDDLRKRG